MREFAVSEFHAKKQCSNKAANESDREVCLCSLLYSLKKRTAENVDKAVFGLISLMIIYAFYPSQAFKHSHNK